MRKYKDLKGEKRVAIGNLNALSSQQIVYLNGGEFSVFAARSYENDLSSAEKSGLSLRAHRPI